MLKLWNDFISGLVANDNPCTLSGFKAFWHPVLSTITLQTRLTFCIVKTAGRSKLHLPLASAAGKGNTVVTSVAGETIIGSPS